MAELTAMMNIGKEMEKKLKSVGIVEFNSLSENRKILLFPS